MFMPKTEKIKELAQKYKQAIEQLQSIFISSTRIYIDYANVRPWSARLGWHIDLKRLKQFLDSFNSIESVNFYNGFIEGNEQSIKEIGELENQKYVVRTKPVKIIKLSIDATSVSPDSTVLLDQFIRRSLLRKYEIETIEYLNEQFRDMNKKNEYYIEDRKCNFDVEISTDMLLDAERNDTKTFVLWSGDSDFSDTLEKLLKAGKKIFIFATTRKVSKEISALRNAGLIIFDIQKIRNFICWNREIQGKRDSYEGAPKH